MTDLLLCLFVAVVIMCEGAALLWGPRWLKWTITVIAAFITLAMLGVCIAYGQTVKPAMPNTHPLVNCRLPDGSILASNWMVYDVPPPAPTRDCTKADIDEAGSLVTVEIKSLQGVLTPAQQAASPKNAWMKPCGPGYRPIPKPSGGAK